MQKNKIHVCSIIFLLFLFVGCVKKSTLSDFAIKNAHIPVFIKMPHNPLVFDNVSPLIYQALHHHFLRTGYVLVNQPHEGYMLRVKARGLDQINKFVSPDIVLVHYTIRLELECALLNFNQQIVAQKTFFFTSLISKSKNPILNSGFVDYEYKRLLERSVPKIERFFRSYLLDAFK